MVTKQNILGTILLFTFTSLAPSLAAEASVFNLALYFFLIVTKPIIFLYLVSVASSLLWSH